MTLKAIQAVNCKDTILRKATSRPSFFFSAQTNFHLSLTWYLSLSRRRDLIKKCCSLDYKVKKKSFVPYLN